jgi:hypothetical protein
MNWRFPESVQADLRQLAHPYYIVNILLCLSFLVAKLTHPLCDYLFAPGPVSLQQLFISINIKNNVSIRIRGPVFQSNADLALVPYLDHV